MSSSVASNTSVYGVVSDTVILLLPVIAVRLVFKVSSSVASDVVLSVIPVIAVRGVVKVSPVIAVRACSVN